MNNIKYGFIKPSLDAHTLGVNSIVGLLKDSGYEVIVANEKVSKAISEYKNDSSKIILNDWLREEQITNLGISYRLDPDDAFEVVRFIYNEIQESGLFSEQGGFIKEIFFGGLFEACKKIETEFNGEVITFPGGETMQETLSKLSVPKEKIPKYVYSGNEYDEMLLDFGKGIIEEQLYLNMEPKRHFDYKEYGTKEDSIIKRLDANFKVNKQPLMRAHVGPYSSTVSREDNVKKFLEWSKELANTNYLDVLSIGTSQLTQSDFGGEWLNKINGGGVPINSESEYIKVWKSSRPLLLRTYAGTKNIPSLAKMHEDTINISWHALSLWWFNKLDQRGNYTLYENLKTHIETIRIIAESGKPFEANVSHHFAFRGGDDVTYIVAAYLSAKLAKKLGIKIFILQNMLNTPRLTWGINDLAKSKAMVKIVRSLEDENFKVILQPRAGLDYFKPNIIEAKIQLAAVSALMDDIEPNDLTSPQIIHVVSYSEALYLATPEIINESIKITQASIKNYREMKSNNIIKDISKDESLIKKVNELYISANLVINSIENNVDNPYSARGLYDIFAAGYLPVPYLWDNSEEFKFAKNWKTRPIEGSVEVIDEDFNNMPIKKRIKVAENNYKQVVKRKL